MTAYIVAATQSWIDRDFSFRVAQCLLHFGWQASAIALAYATVAACFRRNTANVRYGAGVVALTVMFLCLPATFLMLTKWSHNHHSILLAKSEQGGNDFADIPSSPVIGISAVAAKSVVPIDRDDSHEQLGTVSAMSDLRTALFSFAPYINIIYVGGVLIMLSRLILGVSESRRWQRSAYECDANVRNLVAVCCRRLGLRAIPLVAYCERISAPLVVGVIKPIILIPAVLATGLSGKQLELVLLHELAHIRRFDVGINLLQRLIESVLFFHPAVWWVSGRVRLERENACDDMALAVNCANVEYADALVSAAELCLAARGQARRRGYGQYASLSSIGQNPSQFKQRIVRLLGGDDHSAGLRSRFGVVLCVAAFASLFIQPVILHTQEPQVESTQNSKRATDPTIAETEKTTSGKSETEIVKKVCLEGNFKTEPSKLPTLDTREGEPFDPHTLRQDVFFLARTRRFLDVKTKVDFKEDGVIVTFQVIERPTIEEIVFIGNQDVRSQTLRKKSALEKKQPLDPYEVEEARRRVKKYYAEIGYKNPTVEVIDGTRPTDRKVVFLIDEGVSDRQLLKTFEGNTIAGDARLRTVIGSDEHDVTTYRIQFDRLKIDDEELKLIAFYRDQGFFKATIGHSLEYDGTNSRLTLRFVINEGPRYTIRNVSFAGNEHFSASELAKKLKMTGGKPFDQSELDKDLATLQDLYGSHGFVFADVQCDRRLSEDKPELDLVYTITEGKQYRVGRVEIHEKEQHTHFRGFMDRLSLRSGDIIDGNKLHDDERRLKFTTTFPPNIVLGTSSEHPHGQRLEQIMLDLHFWLNAAGDIQAAFSWPSDPPMFESRSTGQIAR